MSSFGVSSFAASLSSMPAPLTISSNVFFVSFGFHAFSILLTFFSAAATLLLRFFSVFASCSQGGSFC